MEIKTFLFMLLGIFAFVYPLILKKEYGLDAIISNLIVTAKDTILTKETEEKFNFVLAEAKKSVPFPLNLLISEARIKEMINEIYKTKFKSDFFNAENKQMMILDKVNDMLLSGTSANQALLKVAEMKNDVKEMGYVEGFINTDFKGNTVGGLKAGIKF